MSYGKDIRAYIDHLARSGYQISKAKGHWHVRCNGRLVATAGTTPSSNRSLTYLKSAVRRYERQQAHE
jgi:predicted nuclease of restriction endonuclease-like (RecB) superfamily